ncbi:hypothetical protein IWX81_002569 [Salinibacterium sp. CAN_S4]
MRAGTMEIAQQSQQAADRASAGAAVLPWPTASLDEYYVPVDPMDDLQCDSCQ